MFIPKQVALTALWSPNNFKSASKTSNTYIVRLLHHAFLEEHTPPCVKICSWIIASSLNKLIQEGRDLGKIFPHGHFATGVVQMQTKDASGRSTSGEAIQGSGPLCALILCSGSHPTSSPSASWLTERRPGDSDACFPGGSTSLTQGVKPLSFPSK